MDTNAIIKQSVELIKQGNKPKARSLLESIIKSEPSNEEAWFLLAHASQTREQAQAYLERVININPNNESARQQLKKIMAMPANKPILTQPAKEKENKSDLYVYLGGIIVLLLMTILILVGIWLKNDNHIINVTSPTPASVKNTITKWEYVTLDVWCINGTSEPCYIYPDESIRYSDIISILDEWGKYGWEVIYVNPIADFRVEFMLKREIPSG